MTHTAQEAERSLRSMPNPELYDICSEAHKDVTGVRGRWMAGRSSDELVAWYLQNFRFDEAAQAWSPVVPFEYDEELEREYEGRPDRFAVS